jgi:hypothetical protein
MPKKKVMEMRWGTYEASYDNLPRLLNTIAALNPGIAAFKHCRPVICIDGTFLTGKYKGTILTALAADGNNQLLPLAIAFAKGGNGDNWYWFLERLKQMVVGMCQTCV